VRLAVHAGPVFDHDGELRGETISVAVRILSVTMPGSLSVSGDAYELAHRSAGCSFLFLGEKTLPPTNETVRVFSAAEEAEPSTQFTRKTSYMVSDLEGTVAATRRLSRPTEPEGTEPTAEKPERAPPAPRRPEPRESVPPKLHWQHLALVAFGAVAVIAWGLRTSATKDAPDEKRSDEPVVALSFPEPTPAPAPEAAPEPAPVAETPPPPADTSITGDTGIVWDGQPDNVQVRALVPHGPAENSGVIHPGDWLLFVKEKGVTTASVERPGFHEDFLKAVYRPPGTKLTLSLQRPHGVEHPDVELELVDANELDRTACLKEKFGPSCTSLGARSYFGKGLPKNDEQAFRYFEMGCKYRDRDGCNDVAVFYRQGTFVAADQDKYHEYMRLACDLDHAGACLEMAQLARDGIRTPASANAYFDKACKLDRDFCVKH
jgi:hypothetical protein